MSPNDYSYHYLNGNSHTDQSSHSLETEDGEYHSQYDESGVFGPGGTQGVHSYHEDSDTDHDYSSSGSSSSSGHGDYWSSSSNNGYNYVSWDDSSDWLDDRGCFTEEGDVGYTTWGASGSGFASYSGSGSDSCYSGGPTCSLNSSGSYTDYQTADYAWDKSGQEFYDEFYDLTGPTFTEEWSDETQDTTGDYRSRG